VSGGPGPLTTLVYSIVKSVSTPVPPKIAGRVCIIGSGSMGAGIAAAFLSSGHEVDLADASAELAAQGGQRVRDLLAGAVQREIVTAAGAAAAEMRLALHAGVASVRPEPELVIEAVPEQLELKRRVLTDAEALRPGLLATNTSGLSIEQLAQPLQRPEAFVGLHFFNPVHAMKLVEVVVGPRTSSASQDAALAIVARIGKEPIVVRDAPGFASTRLGLALGMEAIRMVEDGVASPEAIDRAMELGYRHPVGPLKLTEIIGLDVRLDIASHLATVYGPHFEPPQLLRTMVAAGHLGKKSGRGFYDWPAAAA
jgi:3-hydroxybutyryl-CoA dehydrogenase